MDRKNSKPHDRKPGFKRDGDMPFKKGGDRPFRKDGDKPFKRDGDKPFKKDGDRSFNKRDGDRPFKRDGDRPFKRNDDRPSRQDGEKKHFTDSDNDIRKERASELIAELNAKIPGLGARRAALDVMMLIRKGRTLDQALVQCRSFNALEGSDRSFAHNLVNTTMRRRGAIDEIIGKYLDRPLPAKSFEVQDILRLATAQLVLLETPAHAGVGTSVELAGQKRETAGYKGLVNAITRKIAEKGKAQLEKLPLRADTPGWMWRSWERAYGAPIARDIAAAHANRAPLDISYKPDYNPEALLKEEGAVSHIDNQIRMPADRVVPHLPDYEAGDWWVQDMAASLPARLLGDVKEKLVFDLCAAPGGKTMQLAAMGANVHAVDISGLRLKRVQENLNRAKLHAKTIKADILAWEPEEKADLILLDAPCSATGTIRRNPDVLWSRTEDEVKALAKLQGEFLDKALTFLKPGGLIVYCTCSLQKAEGEDQIKAALSRHDNISVEPIEAEEINNIQGVISREGYLRTLPSHMADKGGLDGFFAAKLRKS